MNIGADGCINPLLLGFLKEWYDNANPRTKAVYRHAYESMKACPIRFQHPSEAIELKYFGQKICEKLTECLKNHCELNGLPMPKVPKKRRRDRNVEAEEKEGAGDNQAPPPRKKKPTKAYIPQKRTGGYALLYALHKGKDKSPMPTKEEIIHRAKLYCDTSFDAPAHAGQFYTAWNSMRTLQEKNYVYATGNPKRYCLTDSGEEVAKGIVDAEEGRQDEGPVGVAIADHDLRRRPAAASGGRAGPTSRTLAQTARDKRVEGQKKDLPPLPYGGRRGGQSDDDEDYRRLSERRKRMAENRAKSPDDEHDGDLAPVQRRLARLYENGEQAEYGKPRPVAPPRRKTPTPSFTGIDLTISPDRSPREALRQLSRSNSNISSTFRGESGRTTSRASHASHTSRAESVTSISSTGPPMVRPPSRDGSVVAPRPALGSKPSFPDFTPEVLKAGSFTVRLVLDNREVRAKNDRDYIQDNLANAGVKPTTRPLQVGDAIWVAHEKAGQKREIVLDYIIERKRLDDLVSSIRDGRFHEQKFRLAKSGLKHVVYIIEDFALRETDRVMQESIDTAISSTQVVNGFFVKKTGKLDDTIRYLVRMTKMLEKNYQEQDLNLIPDSLLESRTYQALRKHLGDKFPSKDFYMNFSIFSTLVSKSASMTLRDIFLKMLMCVRGVSLERAIEIQKAYPTPIELVEAYERCVSEEEMKEMVVKRFGNAVGRKKIGAAVSNKVAEVWAGAGGHEALSEEEAEEEED